MPGVFSVFNIGTGHTRAEPNSTIADLHNLCSGNNKWINDGPRKAMGMGVAQGHGMDPKAAEAVAAILDAKPRTVNLTGHSRGAVICHMIANDLAASTDAAAQGIQEINLILLDPVNMSVHTQRGRELRSGIKLGVYVSIVMENVAVKTHHYPSTTVKPLSTQFRQRMSFLHMPGTHGSGTQPLTSAIGKACHGIIMTYMNAWGTRFRWLPPTLPQLCETFAQVHIDNPVKYDKKGRVKSRLISDSSGMSTAPDATTKQGYQKVGGGRVKSIVANYESMAKANQIDKGVNFLDSLYFFNEFHAAIFKASFPAVFKRLSGEPGDQAKVNKELDEIETKYPLIMESFYEQQILDRPN